MLHLRPASDAFSFRCSFKTLNAPRLICMGLKAFVIHQSVLLELPGHLVQVGFILHSPHPEGGSEELTE